MFGNYCFSTVFFVYFKYEAENKSLFGIYWKNGGRK